MKSVRRIQHSERARIEHDLTLTRGGELVIRSVNNAVRALGYQLSPTVDAAILSGLNPTPGTGLHVELSSPAEVILNVGDENVLLVAGDDTYSVLMTAHPTEIRKNIIEGTVKTRDAFLDNAVDVVDPTTKVITPQTLYRDFEYYLEFREKVGDVSNFPAPTAATAAVRVGTVAIPTNIDLTDRYVLYMAVGEDGEFHEVDCRGATPVATTLAEIIAAINSIFPGLADDDGSDHLRLTAGETGTASQILIKQPADTSLDAFGVILGGILAAGYLDRTTGADRYFKVAEVTVPAGAISLTAGDIVGRADKDDWEADAATIDNAVSINAHRHAVPMDHPATSVEDYHLAPSAIRAVSNKITNHRGTAARITVTDGPIAKSWGNRQYGTLYAHDVELVTEVFGSEQQFPDFEQQYPVRRVDQKQLTTANDYNIPASLNEGAGHRVLFTPDAGVLFSTAHARMGFYNKNAGSGYTDVRIDLHDDADTLLATAQIPIATMIARVGNWMYVDLVATVDPARTYHYHLYMVGFTSGSSPIAGASGVNVAFKEMYLPTAGKYGGAATGDVLRVLDSAGNSIIPIRGAADDVLSGPGEAGANIDTQVDIMVLDTTDGYPTGLDYNYYIIVDPARGFIRVPVKQGVYFPYAIEDLRFEFNTSEALSDTDGKNFTLHEDGEALSDRVLALGPPNAYLIDAMGVIGSTCHFNAIPGELEANRLYWIADGDYYLTSNVTFRDGSKLRAINPGKVAVYDTAGGNRFYAAGTPGTITNGTMTAGFESLSASGGLTAAMEQAEWFTRDTAGSFMRPVIGPRIGIVTSPTVASTWGKPADNVDTGTAYSMSGVLKNIELSGIVWRPFDSGDYGVMTRVYQVVYLAYVINAKIDIQIEAETPDTNALFSAGMVLKSDINVEFVGITLEPEEGQLIQIDSLYETDLTIRARHISGTFNSVPYIDIYNAHRCKIVIEEENTNVITDSCATVQVSYCDDSYIRYSGYRVLHADEQFTSLRGCVLDRKSDGRTPNNEDRQATAFAQFRFSENCDVSWIESNKVYVAAAHASDFHTFNQLKNCRVSVQAKDLQTGSWTDGKAVFVFTNIESSEIMVQQNTFEVRDDLFGGYDSQQVVFASFSLTSCFLNVDCKGVIYNSMSARSLIIAEALSSCEAQISINSVVYNCNVLTGNVHIVRIGATNSRISTKANSVAANSWLGASSYGICVVRAFGSGSKFFIGCSSCAIFGGADMTLPATYTLHWVTLETSSDCDADVSLHNCTYTTTRGASTTWLVGAANNGSFGMNVFSWYGGRISISMRDCTGKLENITFNGNMTGQGFLVTLGGYLFATEININMEGCRVWLSGGGVTSGYCGMIYARFFEASRLFINAYEPTFTRSSTGNMALLYETNSYHSTFGVVISAPTATMDAVRSSGATAVFIGSQLCGLVYTISGTINTAANRLVI